MATSFRAGWTQLSTDFPNYYTAAVLVMRGQPLRDYYDWTWFARQMNYAGVERQLGAYTPQTPLTMLPMMPLAGLPPLAAKRVWLSLDLVFLAATVWMLGRMTRIRWEYISLLLLCGWGSLTANAVNGQYYIFLLSLIVLVIYYFERGRFGAAGFVSGVAFCLKLYTGPLFLLFAAKRCWRAMVMMLAATSLLGAIAIALFGWGDVLYYLRHVLPRTLEGGSIDPYNPGVPTISTLLRRLWVRDPALNPNPILDAPGFFFFAQSTVRLALTTLAVFGVAVSNKSDRLREFAVLLLAVLLLSTSVASYTFVLLLPPIVLLLDGASRLRTIYLASSYILLNNNIGMAWLFPKVWLLVILFILAGSTLWRSIVWPRAVAAAILIILVSAANTIQRMSDYRQEPGRRYRQISVGQSLFAGYPTMTRWGLFYQGMGDQRRGEDGYLLRWVHGDRMEQLGFHGYALQPRAPDAEGPVWFELVANRTSRLMRFDPRTGASAESNLASDSIARNEAPISPDGKWKVYVEEDIVSRRLWIENTATGEKRMLAGGACDSFSPTWELDSSAVVFASDCGRAFGLPALYRAPIER